MNSIINYSNIGRAIDYYTNQGFKYIEVPWVVTEKAINVTLPIGATATKSNEGFLVGSAEQSFIQLMIDGQINQGRYVAATPCFRDENEDEWHQKTFFKVELISIFRKNSNMNYICQEVKFVIGKAYNFFQSLGASNLEVVEVVKSKNILMLHDINLNNIEIGSYGIGLFDDFTWVYGTGLAEPRFSKAKVFNQ